MYALTYIAIANNAKKETTYVEQILGTYFWIQAGLTFLSVENHRSYIAEQHQKETTN
jgi:hypothetical protein